MIFQRSAYGAILLYRRGYWGNKIGDPHTVPMKVSGKCGSVRVRLIPAPRGTHIVGAPTTKKILAFAGIKDCFSSSNGSTKTRGNFMKVKPMTIVPSFKHTSSIFWGSCMTGQLKAAVCSRFMIAGSLRRFKADLWVLDPGPVEA